MSEVSMLDTLRSVEFFHDIGDEHLAKLAKIAKIVEFPANTNIFREHDTAREMYLIISGQVSLIICERRVGCRQLMEVGDGELIGWSPLVSRPRLSDTANINTNQGDRLRW